MKEPAGTWMSQLLTRALLGLPPSEYVWRQMGVNGLAPGRVLVEAVSCLVGLVAFLWLAWVVLTAHVCYTNTSDDCNCLVFTL